MNNPPLISICIPTFNREKYLKECINNIVNQKWFNQNDIEIIISDNASPDNTFKTVKEYQEKYSNIKYYRNDKNIWANLNLFKVSEYANWKYIWFMGDDDKIINWWLKKAIYSINSCNNVVLFQTNSIWKTNNIILIENWIDYFKNVIHKNSINNLGTFLLFLSMVIVKKDDFIKNLNDYKKIFPGKLSEAYSHFYVLIRCINNKQIALLWNMVEWWEWEEKDKKYFKHNSKIWYDLVIINWIDKIYEDLKFLNSIWITKNDLNLYRHGFIKIYYLNIIANFSKSIWLYKIIRFIFLKFIKKFM